MRFGIFDHMELRDEPLADLYAGRLALLEFADQAGFWCYHKAEHHFIRLDAAPSANVFLAAAAQRTSDIRFGPLVYLLPFYEPIRLIEEICSLDHLSHGRLEVGIGKGISPAEHRLWGRSPEAARDRFEEVFAIVRQGLASTTLNHDGASYTFRDAPMLLRPCQQPHPPFWYPGNVEYAGTHGLNTVVGGPPAVVARSVARYRALLADAEDGWNTGCGPSTVGATCHLYLADTDEAAIERVRAAYPAYHRNLAHLWKTYGIEFPPPGDPSFDGNVDAALAASGLVAGSPDTIAAHIERLVDASGIDYVIGAFAWGDLTHTECMRSIALFARDVMPRFA